MTYPFVVEIVPEKSDFWGYEWGCERRYHQQYDVWVYLNMW